VIAPATPSSSKTTPKTTPKVTPKSISEATINNPKFVPNPATEATDSEENGSDQEEKPAMQPIPAPNVRAPKLQRPAISPSTTTKYTFPKVDSKYMPA